MSVEQERAVIDRIVDDQAVVLVGQDEIVHHVPTSALPDGCGEGAVLDVELERAGLRILGVRPEEEEAIRDDAAARLDALRRRPGGRFDR